MTDARAALPKVDRVTAHPSLAPVRSSFGTSAVTAMVRQAVAEARDRVRDGEPAPSLEDVVMRVVDLSRAWAGQRTARVINATGVVLHTNLGRAPLGASALAALAETAGGYVSLEIDRATGRRGGRGAYAERVLAELCGAEAALVVNNNAAAVLLALTSLASGRGVIVSRGELVEIGGGFRIPEVLARSGARMIEVGTTNRTRAEDYARALDENTDVAALLRVHPGNFRQLGFVERPPLGALASLAAARSIPLVEDLGGGLLGGVDVQTSREVPVAESIAQGADLVCFSTDKALGGPQGGAVVGRAAPVERLRRDPLTRALRMGRLPLVALEATVTDLLRGQPDRIPVLAALRMPVEAVHERATRWATALVAQGISAEVVALDAVAGGGAFTEESFASAGVSLPGPAEALSARLRQGDPSVFVRIADDRVVVDGRTVLPGEDEELLRAIVLASAADKA